MVRLHRYVALIALAALGCLVAAYAVQPHLDSSRVLTFILTAGFAIVTLMPVPMPHGRQLELVSFEEALLVPAVLLLSPLELLVVTVVGVGLAHAIDRVDVVKATFNTAQMTIGAAACGACVWLTVGVKPGAGVEALTFAGVGLLAFFVVNKVLVSGVLAITGGGLFSRLMRRDLRLRGAMWMANAAIGVLLVLPALNAPWMLLLALVPLFVMHASFFAHADRSREEDRLRNVAEHVQHIGEDMSVERVAFSLLRSVRDLVDADLVELRIDDSPKLYVARRGLEGTWEDVLDANSAPVSLSGDGGEATMRIALVGHAGTAATLFVRRSRLHAARMQPFSDRDRTLVEMLARQAEVALENVVLFQRTVAEKLQLEQIFEHSAEGLILLDDEGRVVAWNPAMTALSGMTASRMLGTGIASFCPELSDIAHAGRTGAITARFTTPNREQREISASYSSIPSNVVTDAMSTGASWVVVVHDVTREREIERLKDDFVATASHELRTPLTTVIGFIDTLRRNDVDFDRKQQATFLDLMAEQADRLKRLVEDLLDLSLIEAGRAIALRIEQLNVQSEIDSVVNAFTVARPDSEVRVFGAAQRVVVQADRGRLHQIVTNLLENARKHAPGDGPIDVHVNREGSVVRIEVCDYGNGIPASEVERIFDRFYYTADSITRTGQGIGLGLYVCRKLVTAMGGTIEVDSKPGEGAVFAVTLPIDGVVIAPGDAGREWPVVGDDEDMSADARFASN
jgi:PAS domain S-box-containing protein